jgi:hypothetical protein
MQTLQFVRHISGAQSVYSERNVHLLSDRATVDILLGRRTPARILDEVDSVRRAFGRFECFLIEISSLREHWIDRPDGSRFYVNTFCRRDLEAHPKELDKAIDSGVVDPVRGADIQSRALTPQLLPAMREIGELLRRPILWISHIRPGEESPQFESVNRVRKQISDALALNAARLSHSFFDPTTQVTVIGRERFLRRQGADLDHLSGVGSAHLAGIYRDFIASA